jgi:hypothetical protein
VKQFGLDELDADDDAEVPVLMQKAKNIEFERDEGGQLILPPMSEFKTIREKQRVIRGYIGAVYRQYIHFIIISVSELKLRRFHGESKGCFSLYVCFRTSTTDILSAFSPRGVFFERSRSLKDFPN